MYILKSAVDSKLYIGSTNNLERRLKEHNSKLVHATKSRAPLRLIYFEGYSSEHEARHREQNLKLRARALQQLLKRIPESLEA